MTGTVFDYFPKQPVDPFYDNIDFSAFIKLSVVKRADNFSKNKILNYLFGSSMSVNITGLKVSRGSMYTLWSTSRDFVFSFILKKTDTKLNFSTIFI